MIKVKVCGGGAKRRWGYRSEQVVTGTENSVKLELGIRHGVEFSPNMYTCVNSATTPNPHTRTGRQVWREMATRK